MASADTHLMKTPLHDWHIGAGAKMHEFGGFDMPIQYGTIFSEHLATRRDAGLFDISHMGRFLVSGADAVPFLQFTTTNNVLALDEVGRAQYTLIPDGNGGAVDDAYLYRTGQGEYMLVVNAANRRKDWEWMQRFVSDFPRANLMDGSEDLAMMALQGPRSEQILGEILGRDGNSGMLPEPMKNRMSFVAVSGAHVTVSRTGYTGEPVGFEIFVEPADALSLWEDLVETGRAHGLSPVGLGARDTLRLEAGFPLYGHELGTDPADDPIPICALSMARRSTSFADCKGAFVGREALLMQNEEVAERLRLGGRYEKPIEERLVPRFIRPVALLDRELTGPGIAPARQGDTVRSDGVAVGWVTSGTIVPYVRFRGSGLYSSSGDEQDRRAIALAYVDSALISGRPNQFLQVEKGRNRSVPAVLVRSNVNAAAPYARVVTHPEPTGRDRPGLLEGLPEVDIFVRRAVENTEFRQSQAINLIPSEQTQSSFVRLLTGLDPGGRYGEHRSIRAFGRAARDVFYYQGTDFIDWVEEALQTAFRSYLSCSEVEVRPISGQMANKAVFAGLVEYLNRFSRGEPRRMACVMNNHLGRGGHLSAQYLGALRHYVRRDPLTERPAVVPFPVQEDNPYKIDVERAVALIEQHKPVLLVFGKSMVLHPEPIRPVAEFVAALRDRPILLYDAAHVLGLVGDCFQDPFADGADIVTGSTHKTFFGPQRGLIASNMSEFAYYRPLWDGIVNEVFPGDLSNHHLGTLVGLLGSCYEMASFRGTYQKQVIANAKAFAEALSSSGLSVEGDPSLSYTETHQVILNVGRGRGPETARKLEESHIITNYQALPHDASFSDASGIRLGTQEMTRFGMKQADFEELASYLADVVLKNASMGSSIADFRAKFLTMHYCLPPTQALSDAFLHFPQQQ